MKTKYERMSKEEKKELYKEYKNEKKSFSNKMEKMFLLCYIGQGYALLNFIYDFFLKKSVLGSILDVCLFIFCFIALLRLNSIKKELLNNYCLKKDKKIKQEVINKYKK